MRKKPVPKKPPASPAPVKIVDSEKTIPVSIEKSETPPTYVKKEEGHALAPNTTEADDINTAGQRRINLIWEHTQSFIAVTVVCAGIVINSFVIAMLIYTGKEVKVNTLAIITIGIQFINMVAGIVIGFYFSRTNHQAIGGIGQKPEQKYEGR